jgi:hypothetical protein
VSFELELTDKLFDEFKFAVELLPQPALKQAPRAEAQKRCPRCGAPVHYLKSISKYYCFNCKRYVA